MEVVNGQFAIVYKRKAIDLTDDAATEIGVSKGDENIKSQFVRWQVEYRIKQFPEDQARLTSVPYLFSSDFKYMFDFDLGSNTFMIRKSATHEEYLKLEPSLLGTASFKDDEYESIKETCKHIRWEDYKDEDGNIKYRLRILNTGKLDCLFDLVEHDDKSSRKLKLVSAAKVDNPISENSRHMFWERDYLRPQDVLARLIRINQDYKVNILHAQNLRKQKFSIRDLICKIDYN